MTKNIPNTIHVVTREPRSGFSFDEDNVKREYIFYKYIDDEDEHKKNLYENIKEFNRYKDIRPYIFNTIEINKNKDGNHYINASNINLFKESFIATQGPKEKTVKDFWTMIDEQNCKVIVMLCQLIEKEKKKCEE